MSSNKFNRRDFLRMSALAAAGTALAACTPEPTPEPTEAPPEETEQPDATEAPLVTEAPPMEGTIVIMYPRNELSEDEEAQFEADNPGITIEFVQEDDTRRSAMFAAGNPPDMFRSNGGRAVYMVLNELALNLDPYFEASDLLNFDDLAGANYYYFAADALNFGTGSCYGMAKDWSAAMTMFVNTELLGNAGYDPPPDDAPLAFTDIGEMARAATVKEGDRTLVWGYGGDPIDWSLDIDVMMSVAETEGQDPNPYVGVLYDELFLNVNLVNNEPAREVFKFYYDLQAEGAASSPASPSPSWTGQDFVDGKVAIVHEGYWFGAMAESDATAGKVRALPSARWSPTGRRLNWATASGTQLAAASKVPHLAWRAFEWYHAQEPAVARAQSGWGVPALKSQYPLMPQGTDFSKQVYDVLMWELENVDTATPVPFSPWGVNFTFLSIWNKHLEPALLGDATFEDVLANTEEEVNGLLMQAFEQASG